MNRLLTLAQFLFGEKVRWSVFEPLVADRDREVRANRSMALRLRWWCAIAAALATCVPRATLGRLPSSLVLDLGKRALIFATLAYAVQWVDAILTTRRGEGGVPPSIATTAPFLMIPVIWRIRVSSIPRHQQRLLAAAFAATCITVSAAGAETWLVWSGYGASIAWLTVCGWHLAEPVVAEKYPQVTKEGYRLILLTFLLIVAGWPVTLATQIDTLTPVLPRHQLPVCYIIAWVITRYVQDVPAESHRRA